MDPNRPVQNNLFKLVHLSGVATNREDLVDLDFGVVAQDSYRLRRRVQMFQWVETFNEGVQGKPASHTYYKQWTETPIDSTQFKNAGFNNPSVYSWPYLSHEKLGSQV